MYHEYYSGVICIICAMQSGFDEDHTCNNALIECIIISIYHSYVPSPRRPLSTRAAMEQLLPVINKLQVP